MAKDDGEVATVELGTPTNSTAFIVTEFHWTNRSPHSTHVPSLEGLVVERKTERPLYFFLRILVIS